MYRPIEFFIAMRYLRSKNRNRFVSFISLISVIGIALAVAVLIVVLSVMNGFESEVRDRILAVVPHGSVTGLEGKLEDWELLADVVAAQDDVLAVAPFVSGQGMLVSENKSAGVELRGVLPMRERTVSGAAELMEEGALEAL